MKRIALLILVAIGFGTYAFGQDFSFDELAKMRTYPYPKFESYMHDKGYVLSHLDYNEDCTVFKKDNSVVSYCKYYDDGYSYHSHVAIKFETSDKEAYEKLKGEVSSSMDYYTTRLRRHRNEHYLEHIYVNDVMSVHLYDISYRNDDEPYYQVEVFSIYSGY